jgi:hypothetical protein
VGCAAYWGAQLTSGTQYTVICLLIPKVTSLAVSVDKERGVMLTRARVIEEKPGLSETGVSVG